MKGKFWLFTGAFIISVLITFALATSVFLPAKYSTDAICNPEELPESVVTVGQTTSTVNETTGEQEIEITLADEEDVRTLKHELVHKSQFDRLITYDFSCDFPLGRYLAESEANLGEKLPNFLFEIIYGYDLEEEIENVNN